MDGKNEGGATQPSSSQKSSIQIGVDWTNKLVVIQAEVGPALGIPMTTYIQTASAIAQQAVERAQADKPSSILIPPPGTALPPPPGRRDH